KQMDGIAKYVHSILILIICCGTIHQVQAQTPVPLNDHSNFNVQMAFEDSGAIRQLIRETETWQQAYPDSAIKVYLTITDRSKEAGYVAGLRDALQHLGALFASKGMYET